MLIKANDSLADVFQAASQELRRGSLDKKHSFRYVVLSTVEDDGVDTRYLVLRKVDEHLNLYFYTDLRTRKVSQLNRNGSVALLFYHPGKKVQVRINGQATVHHQDRFTQEHWKNVQGVGQRAYNSMIPPGEHIRHPLEAHTWPAAMDDQYFAVIQVIPHTLEVLQLDKLEHLRARFSKEGKEWTHRWIAP